MRLNANGGYLEIDRSLILYVGKLPTTGIDKRGRVVIPRDFHETLKRNLWGEGVNGSFVYFRFVQGVALNLGNYPIDPLISDPHIEFSHSPPRDLPNDFYAEYHFRVIKAGNRVCFKKEDLDHLPVPIGTPLMFEGFSGRFILFDPSKKDLTDKMT